MDWILTAIGKYFEKAGLGLINRSGWGRDWSQIGLVSGSDWIENDFDWEWVRFESDRTGMKVVDSLTLGQEWDRVLGSIIDYKEPLSIFP